MSIDSIDDCPLASGAHHFLGEQFLISDTRIRSIADTQTE